jgi:hypothetical protein
VVRLARDRSACHEHPIARRLIDARQYVPAMPLSLNL